MIENAMINFVEVTVLTSLVIVVILIIKLVFVTRINNIFLCAIWLILMIRLIIPVSIIEPFNFIRSENEIESAVNSNVESFDDVKGKERSNYENDSVKYDMEITLEESGIVIDENGQYIVNGEVIETKVEKSIDKETQWRILFYLWLLGCFVTLIIKIYKISILQFNVGNFSEKSNEISLRLHNLQSYIGIKSKIKIAESIYVDSPIIVGIFEPIIVFPKGISERLDSEKLDMIILHELYHVKRMDT